MITTSTATPNNIQEFQAEVREELPYPVGLFRKIGRSFYYFSETMDIEYSYLSDEWVVSNPNGISTTGSTLKRAYRRFLEHK